MVDYWHNGDGRYGANGFEEPYLLAAFVAEAVFTFIFVLTVLGTTDRDNGSPHFAGLAIGLTLVLVHIVCIPVTGTSVNPARSIGSGIVCRSGGYQPALVVYCGSDCRCGGSSASLENNKRKLIVSFHVFVRIEKDVGFPHIV